MPRPVLYYYHPYAGQAKVQTWQADHFLAELPTRGVEVRAFNPYPDGVECPPAERARRALADIGRTKRITLFLTGAWDGNWDAAIGDELRRRGIPSLLMVYDDLQAPYLHRRIARGFDLVWLTSRESTGLFRRWGARVIHLPYAANPNVFRPTPRAREMDRVGFVGTWYGARWERLRRLALAGIPTTVHGAMAQGIGQTTDAKLAGPLGRLRVVAELARFPIGRRCLWAGALRALRPAAPTAAPAGLDVLPGLPFRAMVEAYSRFALTLGVLDVWNTHLLPHPVLKLHLRAFEVPMSGGIHLVNRSPELLEYYAENKEMVCYGDADELVDKARWWLAPARRKARDGMRRAARARSLAEHTWTARFDVAFRALGLGGLPRREGRHA